MRLLAGDCRQLMLDEGPFDLIVADPPYGDTALEWDRKVRGWEEVALRRLKPSGSMWVFGSMRYFLDEGVPAGWRYAQDVVWEKHNGSGVLADRFRRVHEHAVQLYRADAPWGGVFNEVQTIPGEPMPSRRIKAGSGPQHFGSIGAHSYDYGDTRLMRSVISMRSMHGRAIHPTEKPVALVEILVRTSCPPGGLVGDFFAGSGSAGEACALAGRRYVGCEMDPQMAERALGRLGSNLFSGVGL